MPLVIAGTRVRHPLIVVEELAYPLFIGMDILGPNDAQHGVGATSSIRLAVERCTVSDEMRAGLPRLTCPNEAAFVSKEVTLAPCAASRVAVRLLSSIFGASLFLAEPRPLSFACSSCAALPSVNLIEGATYTISVVNPFHKPVTLHQGMAIAAASPFQPLYFAPPSPQIATLQHLPRTQKLLKVLSELKFDTIKLDASLKQKLLALIDEHLDAFAECDSDGGTTDLVFHEIDRATRVPPPASA